MKVKFSSSGTVVTLISETKEEAEELKGLWEKGVSLVLSSENRIDDKTVETELEAIEPVTINFLPSWVRCK